MSSYALHNCCATAAVETLRVDLRLPPGADYGIYHVVLRTAEGRRVWSLDTLRPQKTASGGSIAVTIPSRILAEADYELELLGLDRPASAAPAAEYYFTVLRR